MSIPSIRPGSSSRRYLSLAAAAVLGMAVVPAWMLAGEPSAPSTAPASGKEVLVIKESKEAQTFDAKGQDVTVNGNRNKVTITGECHALTISGDMNHVSVETVSSISVSGGGNEVTWSKALAGEKPQVTDLGKENTVTHSAAKVE